MNNKNVDIALKLLRSFRLINKNIKGFKAVNIEKPLSTQEIMPNMA
jgi:hypothetical protein